MFPKNLLIEDLELDMDAFRKHANKVQTVLLFVAVFATGFVVGNMNTVSEAQTTFAIGDTEEAFEPLWEALIWYKVVM
jgi:hypothetical protein